LAGKVLIMIKTLLLQRVRKFANTTVIGLAVGLLIVLIYSSVGWSKAQEPYFIDPEYDRKLEKVLFSLDVNVSSLSNYEDIIKNLPDYTEIMLLLPRESTAVIKDEIRKMHFGRRTELIPFDITNVENADVSLLFPETNRVYSAPIRNMQIPRGSVWAQDLFETARTSDNESYIIVPDIHKWFLTTKGDGQNKMISDNVFLNRLSSARYDIRKTPITFKGGNIAIDKRGDKRIAFFGGDVIRQTQNVLSKTSGIPMPSKEDVIEMLRMYFNVDEVVVIGEKSRQPSLMYHLDQAMVLLPNGIAGVTHVVYDNESVPERVELEKVERFLSGLRSELRRLGYRIVDIETTVDDVVNYRYYVNGIPYRNAVTDKREFLMPLFPEAQSGPEKGILMKNISSLEALGYKVIMVPTVANRYQGGIHCLVNVIS
jgi:hypothetical protein